MAFRYHIVDLQGQQLSLSCVHGILKTGQSSQLLQAIKPAIASPANDKLAPALPASNMKV